MAQAPKSDDKPLAAPAIGSIPAPPSAAEVEAARKPHQQKGAMAHLLAAPVTGEATVTVACKHPSGFRLQLHSEVTESEPVMGGGRKDVKVWRQTGEEVFIRGTAHPEGAAPYSEMSGGYALTPGISQAFWERWWAQNQGLGIVKQGLIFAHESHARVRDGAKANEARVTGLERINPAGDPRMPTDVERAPKAA